MRYSVLMALLFISACAQHRPAQTLPEIHVTAQRATPPHRIDAYDAQTLFERGAASFAKDDWELARRDFSRLIEEFPDSPLAHPARYNLGLCFDHLEEHQAAVDAYRAFLLHHPDEQDRKDATFRLAAALERMEAFDEITFAMDDLLNDTSMRPIEKVEALARKGSAHVAREEPALGRAALEEAVRIYTTDAGFDPVAPDDYFSMAKFKLAEITHNEMRAIALPADDAHLRDILERKCQLLLDAQRGYTKVIEVGHPHWSAAAAYRTGALYHHLWQDMLAAPPPAALSDEERGIYMEILRKRTRVLLHKAVTQWRRTLQFANRLQLSDHWIDSTRADLEQIEKALAIEEQVGLDLPVD